MENEREVLLTTEEIELVCKEGANPILRLPYILNTGSAHTSIYKVTTKNALIFIKGNEHTGFEHILNRHNYFTLKNFWKEGPKMESDNKTRLDNPSKFNRTSIPIKDYIDIADSIFDDANLNVAKNNRPDVFDIYDGDFEHNEGKIVKYRLVVYKGTRIVHSLFPTTKAFTRDKVINYAKGAVTASINNEPFILFKIPYHNDKNRIVFCILIRKYLKEKKEECFIEAYDETEQIIITHRVGERPYNSDDFDSIDKEILQWQFRDLTKEEKIIKQIENQIRNKVER